MCFTCEATTKLQKKGLMHSKVFAIKKQKTNRFNVGGKSV